jgi:hypothetical protein
VIVVTLLPFTLFLPKFLELYPVFCHPAPSTQRIRVLYALLYNPSFAYTYILELSSCRTGRDLFRCPKRETRARPSPIAKTSRAPQSSPVSDFQILSTLVTLRLSSLLCQLYYHMVNSYTLDHPDIFCDQLSVSRRPVERGESSPAVYVWGGWTRPRPFCLLRFPPLPLPLSGLFDITSPRVDKLQADLDLDLLSFDFPLSVDNIT